MIYTHRCTQRSFFLTFIWTCRIFSALLFACVTLLPARELVNPRTGALVIVENDVDLQAGPIPLTVTRTLVNRTDWKGALGSRWCLNWEKRIFQKKQHYLLDEGDVRIPFFPSDEKDVFTNGSGQFLQIDAGGTATLLKSDGTKAHFDSQGRLQSVDYRNGNIFRFFYNNLDQVDRITGPWNTGVGCVYNPQGLLTHIHATFDTLVRYEYQQEELSKVVLSPDQTVLYQYNHDNKVKAIRRSDTGDISFTYDLSGRIATRRLQDGSEETYQYTQNGKILRLTHASGAVTTYRWSDDFKREEIENAQGHISLLEYDEGWRLKKVTGPDGESITYTYDELGRLTGIAKPGGQTHHIGYHEHTSFPVSIGCCGKEPQQLEYDASLNLTAIRRGEEILTRITYTEQGLIQSLEHAGEGIHRFTYDEYGRMKTRTDGLGHTTRLSYDHQNHLVRKINPLGGETQWTYDDKHRVISRKDPAGGVTRYTYDTAGRMIQEILPSGFTRSYRYDENGRTIAWKDGDTGETRLEKKGNILTYHRPDGLTERHQFNFLGLLEQETDSFGRITRYTYTPNGLVSTLHLPTGRKQQFQHDTAGNVTAIQDTTLGTTLFQRDAMNQITTVTDPAGATHGFTYDDRGRVIEKTDPLGRKTRFQYGMTDLPTAAVLPSGRTTAYDYDVLGRLQAIRHQGRNPMGFSYDGMGNLIETTHPARAHTYDNAGRRISTTDIKGRTTRFSYNTTGQLVEKQLPDGRTVQYEYTPDGSLSRLDDQTFPTAYRYDEHGRLVEIAYDAVKKSIRFTYNELGLRTETRGANNETIQYRYDGLQRLQAVILPDGRKITFSYDPADRITAIHYPNGTQSLWRYSKSTLPASVTCINAAGDTVDAWLYSYDRSGVPVKVVRHPGKIREYTYDADGRLTAETGTPVPVSYRYGSSGDREEIRMGTRSLAYRYDDQGRIVTAGEERFEHDAAGNLIRRKAPWGSMGYQYDAQGHLVTATNTRGTTLQFGYSDTGERVWKEKEGNRQYFLYDGPDLFQILGSGGDTRITFIHGPSMDRPLAMVWEGNTYFYHGDALGNIAFLTDDDGNQTDTYDMDAFGNLISASATTPNPFIFNGREYEPDLGLYYFRARFYDPALGRFLSPDPVLPEVGDPFTANRYVFGRNAPTYMGDPLGLYDQELLQWAWEMYDRGLKSGYSYLPADQRRTFDFAAKVIEHNQTLAVQSQLQGGQVPKPKIDPSVWKNMPEVPKPGSTGAGPSGPQPPRPPSSSTSSGPPSGAKSQTLRTRPPTPSNSTTVAIQGNAPGVTSDTRVLNASGNPSSGTSSGGSPPPSSRGGRGTYKPPRASSSLAAANQTALTRGLLGSGAAGGITAGIVCAVQGGSKEECAAATGMGFLTGAAIQAAINGATLAGATAGAVVTGGLIIGLPVAYYGSQALGNYMGPHSSPVDPGVAATTPGGLSTRPEDLPAMIERIVGSPIRTLDPSKQYDHQLAALDQQIAALKRMIQGDNPDIMGLMDALGDAIKEGEQIAETIDDTVSQFEADVKNKKLFPSRDGEFKGLIRYCEKMAELTGGHSPAQLLETLKTGVSGIETIAIESRQKIKKAPDAPDSLPVINEVAKSIEDLAAGIQKTGLANRRLKAFIEAAKDDDFVDAVKNMSSGINDFKEIEAAYKKALKDAQALKQTALKIQDTAIRLENMAAAFARKRLEIGTVIRHLREQALPQYQGLFHQRSRNLIAVLLPSGTDALIEKGRAHVSIWHDLGETHVDTLRTAAMDINEHVAECPGEFDIDMDTLDLEALDKERTTAMDDMKLTLETFIAIFPSRLAQTKEKIETTRQALEWSKSAHPELVAEKKQLEAQLKKIQKNIELTSGPNRSVWMQQHKKAQKRLEELTEGVEETEFILQHGPQTIEDNKNEAEALEKTVNQVKGMNLLGIPSQ